MSAGAAATFEAFDHEVRAAIAQWIRRQGAVPLIADIAGAIWADRSAVDAAFGRMSDAHMFIPQPGSHEIYAYNPFCAAPTDFRVRADGRDWWGICGWDALGIPPALGTTGVLTTSCGDGCGEHVEIAIGAAGKATATDGAVLHVGVPARSFWEDIRFT